MPDVIPNKTDPGGRSIQEDRLSRILNEAGAGIFFLDQEGRFLQVNAAMGARLLYAPGELEKRPALDLLHPADREALAGRLREMMDGKRTTHRGQLRYQRKDGTFLWGDMSLSLVLNRDLQFETIIGVVIDINAQKQAEEKLRAGEEWYRQVFEKSGAASIIVAPDMTMVMSNEEFEKLTGYAKQEIENRMKWSEVVAPEDLEMMSRYHYARRQPGGKAPAEYECRVVTRAGELRYILMKVGMLPDGLCSIASFMDITELKQAQKALEERGEYLSRENLRLKSGMQDRFRLGPMVGKSRVMQVVYERIVNAAGTDANAIVYGESGTGKELAARAIHDMSDRKNAPFVVVNCGAVPENLLESEFFGHKKGAFTGADRDKAGVLDQADGGTLFLDEIGELGLAMQVKLLRVIEGMGFRPVGGDRMHHPNVRIIGATNRDLTEWVRTGKMREDFYYRIHVIPIHLPPLRDRKEDIPLLMEKFLQGYTIRGPVPPVTGEMLDAACAYHWPGNVRELQNVLHRYVTLGRFELPLVPKKPGKQPMPPPLPATDNRPLPLAERMEVYERQAVVSALEHCRWHRGNAAESLGINRRTLFKKMKKFGIDHADNENDRSYLNIL